MVSAQPHRVGAELWGQLEPNAGLIILEGSSRKYPYIDAEALVWGGAGATQLGSSDNDATFEALVMTIKVRDPRGVSDTRLGRFMLSTGAVRGVPVDGNIEGRKYDWMVGGRVSQGLGNKGMIGASYYNRFNAGQRSDEEVGGDFALRVASWLDMSAKISWELVNPGLAEVLGTISAQTASRVIRGELYVTKRSPTRMLQSTSLFTVLGDPGTLAAGGNLRWRAAPRLDLWVNGALQDAQDDFGWSGYLRGVLRLDDDGKGSILGELRRQQVATSSWTGLRLASVIPLYEDHDTTVGLMPEFEIIFPDHPEELGGRCRGRSQRQSNRAIRRASTRACLLPRAVAEEMTKRWIAIVALVALTGSAGACAGCLRASSSRARGHQLSRVSRGHPRRGGDRPATPPDDGAMRRVSRRASRPEPLLGVPWATEDTARGRDGAQAPTLLPCRPLRGERGRLRSLPRGREARGRLPSPQHGDVLQLSRSRRTMGRARLRWLSCRARGRGSPATKPRGPRRRLSARARSTGQRARRPLHDLSHSASMCGLSWRDDTSYPLATGF
ncbi:MAG: hypothetical protein JRD94_17750 [Deltaproteobacteria bacterium]|nr:hypothetical protein [Deltaproteobacteria bacterium]